MIEGQTLRRRNDKPTIHDRMSADLPINARVAVDIVDDPLPLKFGDKLKVLRSIRDDPLAGMLSRGWIPQHEYDAGRRWQNYHEAATIGCISAIDPTKEAVDGGRMPDVLTDRQAKAMKELRAARAVLGLQDFVYVGDILGERLTLAQCAARHELTGERGINYIGRRFRDALDTLAILWGFRTKA